MNVPTELDRTSISDGLSRKTHCIECKGVEWYVDVLGEGPAMLMVHGTGASGESFRDVLLELSKQFTLIVPDLPGHGRSAVRGAFEPSLSSTASALGELLESLGVNPLVAVGHSAGAAVVVRMVLDGLMAPSLLVGLAAALYPLRGLERAVFTSTARLFSAASNVLGMRLDETSVIRVLLESTGSALNDIGVEYYRRLFSDPRHLSAVLAMMAQWDLSQLFTDLPTLGTPLLLIAGHDDKAVPLSQQRLIERRVHTAKLRVIARAGHLVHEEQPNAVLRLISDEVKRVCAGPQAAHWRDA